MNNKTDGCTVIGPIWRFIFREEPPFYECCLKHDLDYIKGVPRQEADEAYYRCVRAKGYPILTNIMKPFVWLIGGLFYLRRWGTWK